MGLAILYGAVAVVWYELIRSVVARRRRERGPTAKSHCRERSKPSRATANPNRPRDRAAAESELERARAHYQLAREEARAERDSAIAAAKHAADEADRANRKALPGNRRGVHRRRDGANQRAAAPFLGRAGTVSRPAGPSAGRCGWAAEGAAHLASPPVTQASRYLCADVPHRCLFRDGPWSLCVVEHASNWISSGAVRGVPIWPGASVASAPHCPVRSARPGLRAARRPRGA